MDRTHHLCGMSPIGHSHHCCRRNHYRRPCDKSFFRSFHYNTCTWRNRSRKSQNLCTQCARETNHRPRAPKLACRDLHSCLHGGWGGITPAFQVATHTHTHTQGKREGVLVYELDKLFVKCIGKATVGDAFMLAFVLVICALPVNLKSQIKMAQHLDSRGVLVPAPLMRGAKRVSNPAYRSVQKKEILFDL